MSVCDPVTGMHQIFGTSLPNRLFVAAPQTKFHEEWNQEDIAELEQAIQQNHENLAALIIEPIVQGAGACAFIILNIYVRLKRFVKNIICY